MRIVNRNMSPGGAALDAVGHEAFSTGARVHGCRSSDHGFDLGVRKLAAAQHILSVSSSSRRAVEGYCRAIQ